MRILKDQQGVQAPDGDFVKGRIKNNETLINEEINGDLIEFFQYLVSKAGITENGLPDNVTNEHQLIEALDYHIKKEEWNFINVDDVDLLNGWSQSGTTYYFQYRKNKFGKIELRFRLSGGAATSGIIFRMPGGFRPNKRIIENFGSDLYMTSSTRISTGSIKIETDGYITVSSGINNIGGTPSSYWVDGCGANIVFSTD